MSLRKDFFLDQFDSSFRNHIVEFSKRLTEISKKYDVLILLARKAACLGDCFDELQLSSFHCVVTSSRVLDMNLDWLKTKKVAIVDDMLISGTTINNALGKLNRAGVDNVDVYVLSIDENWLNKDMVSPIAPYFKMNSEQTSLICSNIVKAISVVPRPYTIDYPLYKNIRIRENDFPDISNSANWIVYESTSSLQAKYNIINLTITLSEISIDSFLRDIGLDRRLHRSTDLLLKLRLYALKIKNIYWCQIQPIVILPPIKETELNKLFDKIVVYFDKKSISTWFTSTCREDSLASKLRLIQYVIASRLSLYWYNDIICKVDSNIKFDQDFKNINFVFPPPISETIKNISSNEKINFIDDNIRFEERPNDEQTRTEDDFDELVALYRLSKPFVDLYKKKELKARQLVKDLGRDVYKNSEYKETVNRLNQGYSVADLKEFLTDTPWYINRHKLVSYFLDLYIDKGSVVPITYINNNLIYRAFRHGEDVEFSENEIRLCMSMLEKFSKEYGNEALPHTIVEKLLVLFIRIGIEKGFLSISTNPLSEFNPIGIRYYLHGAIVGSFNECKYKINTGNSLTNVLEESGYLQRSNFNSPYKVNKTPLSGVEIKGVSLANQIGLVMGKLLKKPPKISHNELILMVTCPYTIDLVGAMAAEIYFFQNFYHYQKTQFFSSFESNNQNSFENIRKEKAFTAINSGTWKYISFKEGIPWNTIEKSYNKLCGEDEISAEVWKSFWPSTGKETSKDVTNPEVIELTQKLAFWLFSTRFHINLIELSLSGGFEEYCNSPSNKEIQDILRETEKYLPGLHKRLEVLYNQAIRKYQINTLNKESVYNYSNNYIKENFQKGRQLLSEVDAVANNFGIPDKVAYYENAVVIDYKNQIVSRGELNKIFERVINQVRIEAKKDSKTYLFEIPKQYSTIQTGIWVCSSGQNSRRWLFALCSRLVQELANHATLRFTFFLHLETFRIIKNKVSNEYYAPLFWDVAKEVLKKNHKQQNGHEVIYYTLSEQNKAVIEREINNELGDFKLYESGKKTIEIENPYNIKLYSSHFVNRENKKIKNIMDIGIITIVPEELSAVTDYLKNNGSFKEQIGSQSCKTFYTGKLKDKEGKELNIVTTQAIDQGNRSAIIAYNAIMEEFNPELIVLLGIGGAIHDKLNIGDVAICDSILYYDKRASTERGALRRLDSFKINAWTKEFIRKYHYNQKSEEPSFKSSKNSPQTFFKSYYGPIGTGEAVLKYKDAEERKWLKSVNDKVLAVETEAGGIAQQFYEDELNYSRRAKGILVLRGISDKADVDKKDEWRLAASKNAMIVLVKIFKSSSFSPE
ncbi:hypothetical protein [Porphyromonas gingivalis]|uniref:phosphorylase family protein n=1 Tax=Porphyromonas gingivalis TaxID=837 RepID=UPI001B8AC2D9|nr:hypothetical protein [Porphyromonas gingivalis]